MSAAPALRLVDDRGVSYAERFWSKVEFTDVCWLWTAGMKSRGYGGFSLNGDSRPAHRVAYELLRGPIPPGLVIDHLCRVRHCVNPTHMEPVTAGENVLRGESTSARRARQITCIRGHELDYITPKGFRQCSTCRREARQRYETRRRLAA